MLSRRLNIHLKLTCLRLLLLAQSARRIPTHEQREIWMTYLRSKFRENMELTDPVRLRRAFRCVWVAGSRFLVVEHGGL